ncbi:hypothetical protein AWB78_03056 [Caballeronia calidae]|uniref:Uncharacterized protein n=1 Tax=Caballeronia calidae TaxID=1777139 RepID=A0A158BSK8_9BURK|nr:hypothetical protein AWB78_03056 [Caballeronia calidae]
MSGCFGLCYAIRRHFRVRRDRAIMHGASIGQEPPVEVDIQFDQPSSRSPRSMAGLRRANCRRHCLNSATMHRSQLGIGDRTEVAERRVGLPDDGPPSTLLDIVFGCHAERRSSLNATEFVRTISSAVTRIVPVRATHQPACPASERVGKSPCTSQWHYRLRAPESATNAPRSRHYYAKRRSPTCLK